MCREYQTDVTLSQIKISGGRDQNLVDNLMRRGRCYSDEVKNTHMLQGLLLLYIHLRFLCRPYNKSNVFRGSCQY